MKIIRASELKFIPASHEDQIRPGVYKKVIAVKDELFPGRVQMVNWARLPLGSEFQRHYHEDMEEVFIIISGVVLLTVGREEAELQAGDAIIVSPTEVHTMRNIGTTDADYIVVGIAGSKNGKTVIVEQLTTAT